MARAVCAQRLRLRTLARWAGTLACFAILLVAAAGFTWGSLELGGAWWWYASLERGGVFVSWWGPVGGFTRDIELDQREQMRDLAPLFGFSRPTFAVGDGWRHGIVWMPFWAPLLMVVPPTAWLWWRDCRRYKPGQCAMCGYDLTGNVSGRCPECGDRQGPFGTMASADR